MKDESSTGGRVCPQISQIGADCGWGRALRHASQSAVRQEKREWQVGHEEVRHGGFDVANVKGTKREGNAADGGELRANS